MAFKCRLQHLEKENLGLHHYLDDSDICYYIGEYTKGGGYSYSAINQILLNIKKSPSIENTNPNEYRHKINDMNRVAICLRACIHDANLEQDITLVPIPPSKTITHPDYDDRMHHICNEIVSGIANPDVKLLVQPKADMNPTHKDNRKPTPDELAENYELVYEQGYTPRNNIFLIDDMLTTGTHFKACKSLISQRFPSSNIYGIFITRRIIPPNIDNIGDTII